MASGPRGRPRGDELDASEPPNGSDENVLEVDEAPSGSMPEPDLDGCRSAHRWDTLSVVPSFGIRVVACGLFVSSGRGTRRDRVLDHNELIVVRRGMLSIHEESVRYDVPPEHALLLHAGRRHRGATPFARDLSFYWIHFVLDEGRRPPDAAGGFGTIELPKLKHVERFDCVAELFHRCLDDQEAQRLTPLYATALLVRDAR